MAIRVTDRRHLAALAGPRIGEERHAVEERVKLRDRFSFRLFVVILLDIEEDEFLLQIPCRCSKRLPRPQPKIASIRRTGMPLTPALSPSRGEERSDDVIGKR
jgi:hypothetical protein